MLEQYRYDGSRRPDFQMLPTLTAFDWVLPEKHAPDEADAGAESTRAFLKEKAKANLAEIGSLQTALRAAGKRGLLVLFHGLPYSGRAETIRFLKKGMKKGAKTAVYREGEHLHDFLWQMHRRVPKYGSVCIMKGSVYADIPEDVRGAESVRAFEEYLRVSGISVVRIFLHVSARAQKKRMLKVLSVKPGGKPREIPQDAGWRESFLAHYANAAASATPNTPWYIIPADDKWFARCVVTEIIRDALRECVDEGAAEPEIKAADAAWTLEKAAEPIAEPVYMQAAEPFEKQAPEPVEVQEAELAEMYEAEPAKMQAPESFEVQEAELAETYEAEPAKMQAPEPFEVQAAGPPAGELNKETAEEPAAEQTEAEKPSEAVASEEEKPAETAPEAEEKPAAAAPEAEKKPAGTALQAEEKSAAAAPEAEKKPAEGAAAEAAPVKKEPARRPRRKGPPKTVEETLARRRKRMESGG